MQLNGRKHWGVLQDREGRTCSEMTGRVGDWQTDNRKKNVQNRERGLSLLGSITF